MYTLEITFNAKDGATAQKVLDAILTVLALTGLEVTLAGVAETSVVEKVQE